MIAAKGLKTGCLSFDFLVNLQSDFHAVGAKLKRVCATVAGVLMTY